MVNPVASIPSIDLSPFFVEEGIVIGATPTESQTRCAKEIDEACRKDGFVYVTGFGINKELYSAAFEASKELFATDDKTQNLQPWHPSTNMGYSPFAAESLNQNRPPDLKEAFNIRFPPVHANNLDGCPDSFVKIAEQFLSVFQKAARRYALACALALDLPDIKLFSQTLEAMDLCTIRFLHYPPCDFTETGVDTEKPIRVGEHTDFGAYTFLLVGENGAEGLQMKSVEGAQVGGTSGGEETGWLDVEVPVGTFGAVVNTGALMARWTNDAWNATAHRVIVRTPEEASRDRYSIAVFIDPDAKSLVEVHPKFIGEKGCKYEPITGLAFLLMKLNEMSDKKAD